MVSVEIKLNRFDRVYRSGDTLSGSVLLNSATPFSHNGVTLDLEGTIGLQLSAKSVGSHCGAGCALCVQWEAFRGGRAGCGEVAWLIKSLSGYSKPFTAA